MIYEIKDGKIGGNIEDGFYKIKKCYNNRSLNQNSYYFGVVLQTISEYTGHTNNEMHEYFKHEFLQKQGDFINTYKSTADLDTKEFAEYIENIVIWASAYSIAIPEPN